MVNEPKKRSITGKLVATHNHCRYRCRDRKGQLATHPVSKTVLKEVRRNRFPYKLRVGEDEERPGEL